eukprot:10326628-Lingulodinium_polyedra.AAC.1
MTRSSGAATTRSLAPLRSGARRTRRSANARPPRGPSTPMKDTAGREETFDYLGKIVPVTTADISS